MKKFINKLSISNKLVLYFIIIFFSFSILLYYEIPVLLNYPPDTINTPFDKEVSIVYYKYQFLLVVLGITIFFVSYLKIALRRIDKWWKTKSSNVKEALYVRKKAMTFSYKLYIYMEIFPTLILLFILMLTGSHPAVLLFKIGTIIFSFATLIASMFLILSKKALYPVLVETSQYVPMQNYPKGISLKTKLVFQLFPSVLVIALVLSLIGYYRLTVETGSLIHSYYSSSLLSEVDNISIEPTMEHITDILEPYYIDDTAFCFIEKPDGTIQTSNNSTLSSFFIKYMHDLSEKHDNTVYETYTVDSQAVIQKVNYNGELYTVGIYYEISSFSSFLLFLGSSLVLFVFNLFIIIYVVGSLNNDIENVSTGLKHIINNDADMDSPKLPITSDDELGSLVMELNQIQELNKNQVKQIQDNQDKLMEKERLASLGQLIGGIAHNLKTPIMSISGAAEGLSDLIKEYDSSIGDSEVTENDHHDIAKDMSVWVEKIKNYTEYMSDVITAVKGQAVTLSDEMAITFTVEELIKRVDILMRHELKNALIDLKVSIPDDLINVELNGNVNSLVQVINNMISNSIQAYNGKTNQTIDFIISRRDNNIVLTIKDYAGGLPKEVSDKLFKSMVTTKGKNGTGLGLFMSYSNIRAHFNGNITFNSKSGVGTEFNIILPLGTVLSGRFWTERDGPLGAENLLK